MTMMMTTSSSATNIVSRWCSKRLNKRAQTGIYLKSCNKAVVLRHLSSSSVSQQNGLTPEGEVVTAGKSATIVPQHEVVRFPSSVKSKLNVSATTTARINEKDESVPVLLNSKEHAVGYLSKILNARVYDAAIETELQEAKNLSSVRYEKIK